MSNRNTRYPLQLKRSDENELFSIRVCTSSLRGKENPTDDQSLAGQILSKSEVRFIRNMLSKIFHELAEEFPAGEGNSICNRTQNFASHHHFSLSGACFCFENNWIEDFARLSISTVGNEEELSDDTPALILEFSKQTCTLCFRRGKGINPESGVLLEPVASLFEKMGHHIKDSIGSGDPVSA